MPDRAPRILVADDQRDVLEALRMLLKGESFACETFSGPADLVDALHRRDADAVLMDLNYTRDTTSGEEGLEALARIREFDAHTPVIVMTAWSSIELAVEAMRRGAQDFVEKPWDNARLLTVLRTQVALGRALQRARALEDGQRAGEGETELVADSTAMQPVLELVDRVAPSDANVLVTGESGTGKGLLARLIHECSPRRASGTLVTVNIGSLAETVFESEMFGHVKGAFTDAKSDRTGRFELADGGTLFLDEIANIPVSQQARLLRVLENGEFERLGSSRTLKSDVRVIAATNADVEREVNAGRFREDLLYRLNTVHIALPPLRERGDDLVLLAQRFVERHARRYRKEVAGLSPGALDALRRYAWPGNVRELEHVLERAVLMCRGDVLEPADLMLVPAKTAAPRGPVTLEAAERELIAAALTRHGGDVRAAAVELGVSRSALYRRMDKYGL